MTLRFNYKNPNLAQHLDPGDFLTLCCRFLSPRGYRTVRSVSRESARYLNPSVKGLPGFFRREARMRRYIDVAYARYARLIPSPHE